MFLVSLQPLHNSRVVLADSQKEITTRQPFKVIAALFIHLVSVHFPVKSMVGVQSVAGSGFVLFFSPISASLDLTQPYKNGYQDIF